MKKPKFLLVIDCEGGFYYNIPSPHFTRIDILKWKLNVLRGKAYRYANPATGGIKNLVSVLKKYKFPASFCICGHLYLKKCSGWNKKTHPKRPGNPWYKRIIGDWYHWDKGGDEKSVPDFYLGNFIEKEMRESYFNFGLHGFAHEAVTLEKKEIVESIIGKGIEAAKKLKIGISSFAAPFDMVEEEKDPDKIFSVLKHNKIKNIIYSGKDEGFNRKRDFGFKKILKRKGLNLIWLSNYFEGSFSERKMKNVFRDVLEKGNRGGVYCLATHDFTHKSKKNIEKVVRFIKRLEREGKIEILNLNER